MLSQEASIFKVAFSRCPVQETLGVLGKKWALIILRNIAIYKIQRFNEILKFTPGLNRRTLSMRLDELRDEGIIEVAEKGKNFARWEVTQKGQDVLPILMSILNYGIKWHADRVFPDKKARKLDDIFEPSYITETLSIMLQQESA